MIRTAGLLSAAAFAAAFLIAPGASAQSASNSNMTDNASPSATSSSAKSEAAEMVPARAAIDHTLDARDAKPGQTFQAKLASKVHLKDGQELPRGTMLIGKVGQDDMHESGRSKLALCIDEARLKDGKTIPLKATIVGIYSPNSGSADVAGYAVDPGDQEPNGWNRKVLQVDQINVMSGVDLHSKISSQNSGVLVSTKKDDIKIKPETELALAIAAENQNQNQSRNNGAGGSGL
jgi:hypothetical protein